MMTYPNGVTTMSLTLTVRERDDLVEMLADAALDDGNLYDHIAVYAKEHDIHRLTMVVLSDNGLLHEDLLEQFYYNYHFTLYNECSDEELVNLAINMKCIISLEEFRLDNVIDPTI
jgi:hypothetical protein